MKLKLKQLKEEGSKEYIEKEIYLDGYLKANLDEGNKQLRKDWDQPWFIDGAEGAGKSVLGITCAYYVSPKERRHNLIERIVVKIEDAENIIREAQPFDSLVIDEAFGGMSAAGFMNKLNKMLQRMFTEIRAKNLFIFIIAPTFMDINKYFAVWRSKCLLHVYDSKGLRGFCSFFNMEKKKRLYILGKKNFYNYSCISPNFRFRFTDCAKVCLDFNEYKRRKSAKNLAQEEERDRPTPSLMIECWKLFLKNVEKNDLVKPLTLDQQGKLISLSERSISRYKKLMEGGVKFATD